MGFFFRFRSRPPAPQNDESLRRKAGLSSAGRGDSLLATLLKNMVNRQLRSHQRLVDRIMRAIAANETDVRDVLAAVTPGGGKSFLPVIAANRLIGAGIIERIVWIVPRESLKYQAE